MDKRTIADFVRDCETIMPEYHKMALQPRYNINIKMLEQHRDKIINKYSKVNTSMFFEQYVIYMRELSNQNKRWYK